MKLRSERQNEPCTEVWRKYGVSYALKPVAKLISNFNEMEVTDQLKARAKMDVKLKGPVAEVPTMIVSHKRLPQGATLAAR